MLNIVKPEEFTRYLEISNAVLYKAIRAAFKRAATEGFFITDLLRLDRKERNDISREDWVIRLQRELMPELRAGKEVKYTFMYMEADEAAKLLDGLEKLTAEERGVGTGGIYDRLIEEFPQFRK